MSSEFQRSKLEALVTFSNGRSSPDRFEDGAFPVYGSNGLIGLANEVNAPAQSIVIGRVGSYCGSVHFSWTECWVTDNAIRATAKGNNDSSFLYYLLKHLDLNNWRSGSGQPLLNQATLNSIEVSVPPPSDQKRIGGFIASIDDRITLLRETNATLEAIAQAMFKSWFVDFDPVRAKAEGRQPEGMDATTAALFPDSFEESELGLVPKGWRVIPFLDVCDLQGGAQPPASTFIEEPRDGYVRLLQIRDFSTDNHKTYIPDTKKLKKVTEDDVLIGRYGSASGDKAKDSLGRVCRGLSGSYNVALMKLSPVQVGKEYAFQLVSDPAFYGYLQGVSSKAVQSGFSKNELGQYKVVLPPSEITEYFEQFGEITWFRIKENRKQAQTLTQLRDILLPRLISGQLRLPDAGQAVEEALA